MPHLWDALLSIDASDVAEECLTVACVNMVTIYKALVAAMMSVNRLPSVDPILTARACVHQFVDGFLYHCGTRWSQCRSTLPVCASVYHVYQSRELAGRTD
jgi:hypothetical protein